MRTRLLIFICFISIASFSQEKMNKISISPIQLIGYNRLNLEYERGFAAGKYGLAIYFGQTGNSSRKIHGQYSSLSEQNVSIKFYPKQINSCGFWFGGILSIASGNLYDDKKAILAGNIGTMGILGGVGYQYLFKSFYINTYLSAGYAVTNNLFGSAEYFNGTKKPTDILLTYGFKTGFCF